MRYSVYNEKILMEFIKKFRVRTTKEIHSQPKLRFYEIIIITRILVKPGKNDLKLYKYSIYLYLYKNV